MCMTGPVNGLMCMTGPLTGIMTGLDVFGKTTGMSDRTIGVSNRTADELLCMTGLSASYNHCLLLMFNLHN